MSAQFKRGDIVRDRLGAIHRVVIASDNAVITEETIGCNRYLLPQHCTKVVDARTARAYADFLDNGKWNHLEKPSPDLSRRILELQALVEMAKELV